jgi:DNA-binding transcriptional ArsR family regulator
MAWVVGLQGAHTQCMHPRDRRQISTGPEVGQAPGGDGPGAKLIDLPPAPDAIELRHLRAFVAVAEELNFSRAAERLYLTQPALSRQIRALERLLGVDLLRRSTHQVELTLGGEALLNRAARTTNGWPASPRAWWTRCCWAWSRSGKHSRR